MFEWRTDLSNVSLGLEMRRKCDSKHLSRVKELLDSYGLQYFYDAHPSELSGGMRQPGCFDPDSCFGAGSSAS